MTCAVLYQYPADNVAGAYSTIGVNTGTEDPDYPAAYLADGRPGRPAKLTTTTGSWVFAFASAQRIDLAALGAHNITAAVLQGNATNAWGAPTFEAAFVIPAASADGQSRNAWLDATQVGAYSPTGFQFWRLLVSGPVACAIGEVWLGETLRVMPRNYSLGFTIEETHATIEHRTEFLIPSVYALGSRQRRMALSFRVTAADALTLREWYRGMFGPGRTGLFIPESNGNDAWWVRQANDYTEAVPYGEARDISMTLVEHATGVPL